MSVCRTSSRHTHVWGWWGAAEGCSGCGMLSVGGPTQTPRREEGALSISALPHPCKHMRRQNEDMHLKSASSGAIFQVNGREVCG